MSTPHDAPTLRRKLFEVLGGDLSINEEDRLTVHWNGKTTETNFYGAVDPLDLAGVPNWPEDAGAALALCLEIGASMFPRHAVAVVDLNSYHAAYLLLPGGPLAGHEIRSSFEVVRLVVGDTPARALSALALAALEGERTP